MPVLEVNFDGLVGPTHNYSGLSSGNLASVTHGQKTSNPREAVLQGLGKMRLMLSLGLPQAVLPPQERPHLPTLRREGFIGSDAEILAQAAKSPFLLNCASSASSMWAANAATVAPSVDSTDGKTHFTPANLVSKLHRSIEPAMTSRILKKIFSDDQYFRHHDPLPASAALGDEGSANHTRLAATHSAKGVHLFVYGRTGADAKEVTQLPARQTREASESVARLHRLPPEQTVFARQLPAAIDAGVFHNDVISVGNENVFFYHEETFAEEARIFEELRRKWDALGDAQLVLIPVAKSDVPLVDAVKSYLFNSQLVTLPDGRMALIAPQECEQTPTVKAYLDSLIGNGGPIAEVRFPQLRQSMQNGGGPACLRLRVPLTEAEWKAVTPGVRLDGDKIDTLEAWAKKHYRDKLSPADLADPKLLQESRTALDDLTQILGLGSLYDFQA